MFWLWNIFLVCVDGGPFLSPPVIFSLKKKKLLILDGLQLPMTVGEISLKDVWSGFSFFFWRGGEALPTLEDLAVVKSNFIPLFSPRENTNKFLLISRELFGGSFGRNATETGSWSYL